MDRMGIVANYVIYTYDWFLEESIDQIINNVDKIFIARTLNPWFGSPCDLAKTNKVLNELKNKYGDKLELFEGIFKTEQDQRNYLLNISRERGYNGALIIDADEIFLNEAFEKILKYISQNRSNALYCPYYTFIKDASFVVAPPYEKGLFYVNLNEKDLKFTWGRKLSISSDIINEDVPFILHFSYIRETDEDILQKINNFTHANDINWREWYIKNYLMFNKELKNFHPTDPERWRSLELFDIERFPKKLLEKLRKNGKLFYHDYVINNKDLKLHLGCGNNRLKGYINIDLYTTSDLRLDITDLRYFDDNSVNEIFMNAVFEHLYNFQQLPALKEWWRVLKPGGKLIINSIPDFDIYAKAYFDKLKGNWSKIVDLEEIFRYTHGAYNDKNFFAQLHKDIFNKPKIEKLINEAGFEIEEIKNVSWNDEPIPCNINVVARKKCKNETKLDYSLNVSIIIPVFNNLNLTQRCLDSIIRNTQNESYEIILVDNGSTDGTKEFLRELGDKKITPLFLNENKGFVEACNLGAKIARGKYLIFLNNDTEVTPKWLEPLIQTMESNSECGAVGSKLIYPDGRLQEAGGIVFSDGHGWNYGRGMDPSDPRFNFIREVDYCSGAALMVRRSLWDEIGGFDSRYAPAYYEDTDLCFEIRKRGFKVYYQPKSIVLHHEGKTAGTKLQSGFKRFQEINRKKFIEKWKNELQKQYPNHPRNVIDASDRQTNKNILVIDAFLPFYDRASGSLRLFHILKLLKKLNFHITFIARNGSLENQYRPILEEMGIEVYAGDYEAMRAAGFKNNSFKLIHYDHLFKYRSYDFALIEFWEVANYYIPIIRKLSPQTEIIVDSVDIHFIREIREAELKQNSELMKKAQHNKEKEIAVYREADRIWVVTEPDKKAILNLIGNKPIDIIPNIHKSIEYIKTYEETSDLLFIGNFNHPPNRDAIQFFCAEIFPIILRKLPDVKLYIVGNNPPEEIKALSSNQIKVTGYVSDLSPYFKKSRISVNPLRYGAGMKGKIGEALSWGLPVVTTSIGAEGMDLVDGEEALIADSPEEFSQKVIQLYQDPNLWKKLSDNGKRKVEANWTPEVIREKLEDIFEFKKLQTQENLVSIIIPVHNQLGYTKKCFENIFQYTDVPFELIIINNGSNDETLSYLKEIGEGKQSVAGWAFLAGENGEIKGKRFGRKNGKKKKKFKKDFNCKRFKVISNRENLGFAAGINQGIAEAKGNYILLMNNDVIVTPGWLSRMLSVAEKKTKIGLVGPLTNYVTGPQKMEKVDYDPITLNGLTKFAEEFAQKNEGKVRTHYVLIGFCLLIKRSVVEKIGGLDERYGLGNFEDIDFCFRAHLAGFESVIAEDCFVHHFGHKTFLGLGMNYNENLRKNFEIFKKKWGIPEEVDYEADYDLGWILTQKFNPVKHHFPVTRDRLSISQAEELFHLGDEDGAKILLQKILFFDPKNIEGLNDLGVICFHQGEIDQAVSYFTQVLELDRNHYEAIENISQCLIRKGKFQEAIPWLKKALSIHPGDEKLLNSLANCFIQIEDFLNAEEVYKTSYQINNQQPHVINILQQLERLKTLESQKHSGLRDCEK